MKYKPAIVAAFFKSEGLPSFVTEHTFHTERKWRFDFAWLEEKVALEVEGGCFVFGGHSRGAGMRKDMEKYNNATLLGWKIIRVMPEQLCRIETVFMLKKLLGVVKVNVL